MKYFNHVTELLVALLVIDLITPRPAYAYLDPGTGSYFLQVLLAAVFGALFALKIFWKKIIAFIGSTFNRSKNNERT